MVSLSVHVAAIALVLLASRQMVNLLPPVSTPTISLFAPPLTPRMKLALGGAGGARQSAPATQGHLPKIAARQFVPPVLEAVNLHPILPMEATIEAPPEIAAIDRPLPNIGDPLSRFTGSSAGMGGPLGIGNGPGTGVGDKRGPGAGAGDSLDGTVYRGGKGITIPVVIHQVEPEFSEEARKSKHSGTVTVRIDVDVTGHPRNLRIVRSLGMGLDEKAVEAVSKWLFRPGTKDGKPVPVTALIEVAFHLL